LEYVLLETGFPFVLKDMFGILHFKPCFKLVSD